MMSLFSRILRFFLRAFIELFMGGLMLIAFSPAFVGMAIIGFQFFVWLVTHNWTPIPVADALSVIGADPRFLDHLQIWEGLAEIIRFCLYAIPLSSCFLVAGFILSGCMAYIRWSLLDLFEMS